MNNTRNTFGLGVLSKTFAILACAGLPGSALAQTAATVNDQIKQLQGEIRNIQKNY